MNTCHECGSSFLVTKSSKVDGVWMQQLVCRDCEHVLHREVHAERPTQEG